MKGAPYYPLIGFECLGQSVDDQAFMRTDRATGIFLVAGNSELGDIYDSRRRLIGRLKWPSLSQIVRVSLDGRSLAWLVDPNSIAFRRLEIATIAFSHLGGPLDQIDVPYLPRRIGLSGFRFNRLALLCRTRKNPELRLLLLERTSGKVVADATNLALPTGLESVRGIVVSGDGSLLMLLRSNTFSIIDVQRNTVQTRDGLWPAMHPMTSQVLYVTREGASRILDPFSSKSMQFRWATTAGFGCWSPRGDYAMCFSYPDKTDHEQRRLELLHIDSGTLHDWGPVAYDPDYYFWIDRAFV